MAYQSKPRRSTERCRKVLLGVIGALLCSGTGFAGDFVEPAVFASSNGLLDLLMIAQAQPVPSISFLPPDGSGAINPIGWV
jgi:hypothetical protein